MKTTEWYFPALLLATHYKVALCVGTVRAFIFCHVSSPFLWILSLLYLHSIIGNLKNWAGDRAREQRFYFKPAIFPELPFFTVACQLIRDVRDKTGVASDYSKSSIKHALSIKHPLSLIRPSFPGEQSY